MKKIESPNAHVEVVHKAVMGKGNARDSVAAFMTGIGELLDNAAKAAEGNGATPEEIQPFRDLAATLAYNKDAFVEAFEAKGLLPDDPIKTPSDQHDHDPKLMSQQTTPLTANPSPLTPATNAGGGQAFVPPVNPPAQPAGPTPPAPKT